MRPNARVSAALRGAPGQWSRRLSSEGRCPPDRGRRPEPDGRISDSLTRAPPDPPVGRSASRQPHERPRRQPAAAHRPGRADPVPAAAAALPAGRVGTADQTPAAQAADLLDPRLPGTAGARLDAVRDAHRGRLRPAADREPASVRSRAQLLPVRRHGSSDRTAGAAQPQRHRQLSSSSGKYSPQRGRLDRGQALLARLRHRPEGRGPRDGGRRDRRRAPRAPRRSPSSSSRTRWPRRATGRSSRRSARRRWRSSSRTAGARRRSCAST